MINTLEKVGLKGYSDELSDSLSLIERNRIYWICENATGESILDVGCSQGLVSILLGREAKKVIGIDILGESIYHATEILEKESDIIKKYIEFRNSNFIEMDFGKEQFDTIIFGNVLDLIIDPQRYINKAFEILRTDGKMIITVPFGINGKTDYKKVYYLLDLFNLVIDGLEILEIKFFDQSVGMILKKQNEVIANPINIDRELLRKLEKMFYKKESELVENTKLEQILEDKFEEQNREKDYLNNQLKIRVEEISKLEKVVNEKEEKILQLTKKNGQFLEQMNLLKTDFNKKMVAKEKAYQAKLIEVKEKLVIALKDKINSWELLKEAYKKEAALLATHEQLLKKYEALSSSKLGRLTKTYWKFRAKKRK